MLLLVACVTPWMPCTVFLGIGTTLLRQLDDWAHPSGRLPAWRCVPEFLQKVLACMKLSAAGSDVHSKFAFGAVPNSCPFEQAFKMVPENAVISLFIGVAYLTYALSRSPGDRHAAILKAFAFLTRYAARAGSPAEAAYNLGRAFHQLDLLQLATEWYNRCLALLGTAREEEAADGGGDASAADVSFECAHNLALIYEGSGAAALAARVRATYCSV